MLVLIGIGFVAGLITAVSPCVLPVLPILLAGSATGASPRRPLAIVGGLVASFTVFTLLASRLLRALDLPQDFLRDLAIVLLFVVAATLLFPPLARLAERPLLFLTRRSANDLGGGFLLGVSLGLVFVPCAGPVLAAITVVSANQDIGARAVAVTLAYALGAAAPMLAIAWGGQRVASRLRAGGPLLRRAMGAVIAVTALAIAFDLDRHFTTAVPGYTTSVQDKIERSAAARRELARLTGVAEKFGEAKDTATGPDFGRAPEFAGINHWLNSEPLTMRELRGKVVLVDFWTYSCINCLRTLPHLKAWWKAYKDEGFVIVGVHTPEFAFEHSLSNVRGAVKRLGVRYPVALDNDYGTWNAWANQYWPADYLVDKRGHVRHVHFGEGDYAETEETIQKLLGAVGPMTVVRDRTPEGLLTPETYVGYSRLERFLGTPVHINVPWRYELPKALPLHHIAYGGTWTLQPERAVAGKNARLRLHFLASKVYLVLAGKGAVHVAVDGRPVRTVRVGGDKLYTLVDSPHELDALLELRFTRGVSAYAFTFG